MTKTTFLEALRQALAGLPQSEIDEAVAYYAGYIDDAGEGNQQKVLKELGDPWTIVKKVDRGMRKISKAQPRHARRTKVQPD